jgi:hypothetical protein
MIPGIVDSAVSAARAFTDEFAGTGALASRWTSTTGSWSTVSDKSYTATAASSYPLATFNANTKAVNVRVDYGTADTHGWGVAFWVQDSSNWWAVVTDKTYGYVCSAGDTLTGSTCKKPDTTYDCSYQNCYYECPAGTTLSGAYCYGPGCPNGGSLGTGNCDDPAYPCYIVTTGSFGDTCEAGGTVNLGAASYPCTTVSQTCTATGATYTATTQYTYKIKLIKSVAGTITEVATQTVETSTVATSTIGYVQASVSKAGVITATAMMNGGSTVQTLTNTPSSPTTTVRHGFILAPSTTGTQATGMERFIYSPV